MLEHKEKRISLNKSVLNYIVIALLSLMTFSWTFWIFHGEFLPEVVITVIGIRLLVSTLLYKDYSLSWSKATPKSFLIKSIIFLTAFIVYMPVFYTKIHIYILVSELFTFLFSINFLMFAYSFHINKSKIEKTKTVAIYGAGKAGLKLEEEFHDSP